VDFFERTILSVYAATPPEVLHEIIVVDDNSSPPLESLFHFDPADYKLKFVRSNVTLGLIDAKHQGAEASSGDIIVFFDCHVKPALGYWVPFVREIADNPKRVVVPAITALNVDTWVESNRPQDQKGGSSKCYLTFDVDFKWVGDETPWVPIMSGGLLAIGREWFFKIGGHDQAMKGWGGENIDLSLRIWRCGGEIVAATKSFVGHMWRVDNKKNTKVKYKIPANSATLNRARAIAAHAPEFFRHKTLTFGMFSKWKDTGGSDLDVESIQAPMKELQCKDFEWYLDFFKYIYNDGGVIPREVFQITPDGGKTCLQLKKQQHFSFQGNKGDDLAIGPCLNVTGLEATSGTQYWHKANRNKDGRCCGGLRAWNTGQCLLNNLKTSLCNMNDQPAEMTAEGLLKVGDKNNRCLSANPLRETSCNDATDTWKKLRPFEPQEYRILSQELKDKWNKEL
jgi:polypeptide N-acetylgalactosaminyltransferase